MLCDLCHLFPFTLTYVDDVLCGTDNEKAGYEFIQEIMNRASFPLAKWSSNNNDCGWGTLRTEFQRQTFKFRCTKGVGH